MPEQNEGLHKDKKEKVKKQGYLDIEHLNDLEEMNMHLELIERARKYREKKDYNIES